MCKTMFVAKAWNLDCVRQCLLQKHEFCLCVAAWRTSATITMWWLTMGPTPSRQAKSMQMLFTYMFFPVNFILKGVWHEIFSFKFFSWISFSRASSIPIKPLRIFSNIRRYIREWMFISDVNNTGDKREKFLGVNMSLFESTTPAKNFHSWISSQFFGKIRNGSKGIIRGLGTLIHEQKSWSRNSRVRLPLHYFLSLAKTAGTLTGFEPGVAEKTLTMIEQQNDIISQQGKHFETLKKQSWKECLVWWEKTFQIC